MVRADSHEVSRVPCYLGCSRGRSGFRIRGCHLLWLSFPEHFPNRHVPLGGVLQPRPDKSGRFGLVPFRSPLLRESLRFLFLRLLRCFTSAGSRRQAYGFSLGRLRITGAGFPHSEIPGSERACRSPGLIAVMPRPSSPHVAKASACCPCGV